MLKTLTTAGVCAAAVLTATPAQAATCGTLPPQVQGNPAVRAGQAAAAYLWHDTHGWQLRVTHPGTRRMVVTGTVTVSRSITHVAPVRLERGDAVAISRDGRTLTFRMADYGHLDGVSFTAECSATMRVSIKVDGAVASPAQVFLGAHRTHPSGVPFTIRRT